MIGRSLLFCLFLSLPLTAWGQSGDVDPMLGIDGGGNTFPGASLPFGMLKAGPDMGDNTGNAGWLEGKQINGFSQTHVSGTGGGAKYGNILIQPITGPVRFSDISSAARNEGAAPGYFRVELTTAGTQVEIAAAQRAALYRFHFVSGEQHSVIFDASHLLSSYANQGEQQSLVGATVHVLSPTAVAGSSTVTGGWNLQATQYQVYFYAETDVPSFQQIHSRQPADKVEAAALSFAAGVRAVQLRVGISFLSEEKAQENARTEIPQFDFEGLRQRGTREWDRALSKVSLAGVTQEPRRLFYTALYHTMLMPVDRTGENPLWQSDEPSYDDFYTLWDTFRTSGPLLTLLAPKRQSDMLRALVDVYRHEGWLPDGRTGEANGRTQGGSNADLALADAYVKHLEGLDWPTAYAAMVKDAEETPGDGRMEGRSGVQDWKALGFVSRAATDRPGSKQMEYAADDYGVAVVAAGLGHADDAAKYRSRARNWDKLWDEQATDGGFSGFIWPKDRAGIWKQPFDALATGTWGGDTFYEGNSWTYSTFVPHDVARLITLSGGPAKFVKRLDAFFSVAGRYDVGNEPGFLSPYLYLWAGRQDRTADQLRTIIAASYHAGRSGLPGNDDSGAMSSWFAFGKMGFYPNAGQDVYLIGSPAYPEMTLTLANGKTFTVIARNVSEQNRYIAAASWDGKPWTQSWFRHADLMRGGRLVFTMGSQPTHWESEVLPPSDSTTP